MQNNNRKVTVWLYLFYGIIYPYLYWINFGMKKILLFSLVNWIYAFELFERASKKELPNAITSLGFMYQNIMD